ncbi:unnamed protein product [Peniophora sp. CBMAI 1063]|nr:unnamed protein product [Peniophora sp. CBMAI 1063]
MPAAPSSVRSYDSDSDVPLIVSSSSSDHPSHASTPALHSELPKHPRFYFKDGTLSFSFKDLIFRVHGSLLASLSTFWAERMDAVETLNVVQEDTTVSSAELSSFLSIVYPKNYREHELQSGEEWTAVLRLATMWKVESIRELAIQQLDDLSSPLERLVLSRSYDVQGWLLPAFVGLIMRENPLTLEEMRKIELQDLVVITTAREAMLSGRLPCDEEHARNYVLEDVLKMGQTSEDTLTLPRRSDISSHTDVQRESRVQSALHDKAQTSLSPWQYAPLSDEDFRAIHPILPASWGVDWSGVIRHVRSDNLLAFCEMAAPYVRDTDIIAINMAIFERAARESAFIPLATSILSFVSRFEATRTKFDNTLQQIVDAAHHAPKDASDRRLAAAIKKAGYTWVMGDVHFLAEHPEIYAERCANMTTFREHLVRASLLVQE